MSIPDAPDGMAGEAVLIWNVVVTDLIEQRVFRPSDVFLLEELVETWADARRFRRAARDVDPDSAEAKRLGVRYEKNMALVLRMAAEFAISPVSRTRLGLVQIKGATLLSQFEDD